MLRIPMRIGEIVRKVTMARFSRTLATLVARRCGHHQGARDHGADSGELGRRVGARGRSREACTPGEPIAEPLTENSVFPPIVAQMIKIGEESGELQKMLDKIADFYEDEVDAADRLAHDDHRAAR